MYSNRLPAAIAGTLWPRDVDLSESLPLARADAAWLVYWASLGIAACSPHRGQPHRDDLEGADGRLRGLAKWAGVEVP